MSKYYLFSGMDSYDTPDNVPVSLVFKLMGRSRWYFYYDNFKTFIQTGICGKKGRLDQDMQIMFSSRNIKLIERCGGRVHLRGLNHLRELGGKPVVIVGNHMSLLETAAIHAVIREYVDFSFVVKESLLHVPFFKHILLSFNSIPVGRTNPREDLKAVLTQGKKILESGRSMVIFPQSTRTDTFEPEHFNSIGVKLAKSAGVSILPMALKTDFISTGKGKLRDLGPIHPERDVWFEFGAPIPVEGNGQDAHHASVEFIGKCFDRWKNS